MIGWLSGNFVEVSEGFLLLDAQGVGYELEVTAGVLGNLPARGEPLALYAHLVVREDAQLLYGFESKGQRDLFRTLIRVNGVGPKLGLGLLSAISVNALAQAVNRQETAPLTAISGVGKKTAERLLVELKGKMDAGLESVQLPHEQAHSAADAEVAVDALQNLGYKPAEAAALIAAAQRELEAAPATADGAASGGPETLVRLALRSYGRANAGS
ncbi:MAG: Holliday junction branch migration protein RuvA [Pseudomonadales bacterium]